MELVDGEPLSHRVRSAPLSANAVLSLAEPIADPLDEAHGLGVVLYEALTAQLPFSGDTATAIIDQILHHEPAAFGRLNYDIPSWLEDIVRKLMAKSPEDSYQTARDLIIDVRTLRRELDSQTSALLGVPVVM